MVDSFYAHILTTRPVIRLETMQIHLPCREDLFEAPSAKKWMQLAGAGGAIISPSLVIRSIPESFPTMESELCIYGLLSTIWLSIAEARHRLLAGRAGQDGEQSLIPDEVYRKDPQAGLVSPLLVQVVESYNDRLQTANPNCMTMWHSLCLMQIADPCTFELAAGRDGAKRARQALDDIAIWTQTAAARRACLHAAQIFAIMSHRKTCDGIMFHSEVALFSAALVLGFYLFTVPEREGGTNDSDLEAFEITGEVDWRAVGCEGLACTGRPTDSNCAAKTFIRNGGPISFCGSVQRGGYDSARRLFLDYEGLLDDVGKWNVHDYCRILRAMIDCLVENDGGLVEWT